MKTVTSFLIIFVIMSIAVTPITAMQKQANTQHNNLKLNKDSHFLFKDRSIPIIDRIIDFLKSIPFINRTINFIKNLLNIAEEGFEDGEDKQDLYNIPFYEGDETDPGKATSTDRSISVRINDFNFDFTKIDHTDSSIEWSFDGETSGNVIACYWIMVEYFEDGTNTYHPYYWNQPMDSGKVPIGEFYFKGKGPGGNTDWSKFEMSMRIENTFEQDYSYLQFIDQEVLNKEIEDIVLYVRAFSDKELTMWNQDSMSVKNKLLSDFQEEGLYSPSGNEEDDDDKGFLRGIPGFELVVLLLALFLVIVFKKKTHLKK